MDEEILQGRVREKLQGLGQVEVIVGIPSYNNVRTIGYVVKAAREGLGRAFPGRKTLIVNSDGGSKDGTPEAVLEAGIDHDLLMVVEHPLYPVHRLTTPYHGLPGKGSAFRTLFRIAELAQARALAVVDADVRSITPEWFSLLLQPVLALGYDFVAPHYQRDKYDGTVTNGIVYPLTRALYGRRIRQPIGGEFGVSRRLLSRFLTRNVWSTDVARYGIDIWMTTTAIAENFQICQTYLGAKTHDAKDPLSDLSTMLAQVVGSVFELMETYDSVWRNVLGSLPAPLLGIPFEAGPEPVEVNLGGRLALYRQGMRDLLPVYQRIISSPQLKALDAGAALPDSEFTLPDELWVAVIYDFALAYHRRVIDREHLLKSLTPLYQGWVASFARQVENETATQSEGRIEKLSQVFEQLKPYLINQWPLQAGETRSVS